MLPVKRFSVPIQKASSPIPTLTGRQFVVSKMGDAHEKATRELFWYREELLERLKATWKEVSSKALLLINELLTGLRNRKASGSRHGELSLRRQRFTQPMMYALRTDGVRVRIKVAEIGVEHAEGSARSRTRTTVQPNDFVLISVSVQNLTGSLFGSYVC